MAEESIFTAISVPTTPQNILEYDIFNGSTLSGFTPDLEPLYDLQLPPCFGDDLNGPPRETEEVIFNPQDDELAEIHNTNENAHSELLTAGSSAQTQNYNMGAIISADRQFERVDEAAAVGDLAALPEPVTQTGASAIILKISAVNPSQVEEIQYGGKRYKCVPIEDYDMSGMETTISSQNTDMRSSICRESNQSLNQQFILGSTNMNVGVIPTGREDELNSDSSIVSSVDLEENVSIFHETNTNDGAIPSTSTSVNTDSSGVKPGKRKSTRLAPNRKRVKKIYSSNEYNQLTDADIDSCYNNLHELLEDARGEISGQNYNESKIITVYGKEAFRRMFSDDEIMNCSLSGRIQGKSKKKMGKFSGVKKSIIARFLAFLISKREITWANFKEFAISREKGLCLSADECEKFEIDILVKYANVVRGQLNEEQKIAYDFKMH